MLSFTLIAERMSGKRILVLDPNIKEMLKMHLKFFLCVCAHVYVRTQVCVHYACVHLNLEANIRCPLQSIIFLITWSRVFHWTWSSLIWLGWLASKSQGSSVSSSLVLGSQVLPTTMSHPHVCTESTLPSESFPQPIKTHSFKSAQAG